MLKNKLFLYGDDSPQTIPASLHLGKYILNKCKSSSENFAIINAATDERITYKELTQQIVDVALSLVHIGVKKGDVVSTCSGNVMEFMPLVYGTMAIGATFSGMDMSSGKISLLHKLNIARPKVLFCSPSSYEKHKETMKSVEFIEKIIIFGEPFEDTIGFKEFLSQHASVEDFEAVPVNGLEDVALIIFSSGTSGVSKGIQLTHLNVMLHIQEDGYDAPPDSMYLAVHDWYLPYGLTTTMHIHQRGSTCVFYSNADIKTCYEVIQNYKINMILTTPTTVTQLMKQADVAEYDTSSLQIVYATGSICDGRILQAFKERVPSAETVVQFYGMTEVGSICSPFYGKLGAPAGSVGCARPFVIVKVVDVSTREPLGANQRGEICVKSPSVMKGYIGESIDWLDEEGFFKTGDIGYYDEDKYVYVVDRIKDLIKFNNYQVPPAELEAVLLQHPAVREAGVVGARSEQFHQLPVAFVALQPGATASEQELVEFVDRHVSPRMRLAGGVRFLDALPYVFRSKLDRKKLRQMLEEYNNI